MLRSIMVPADDSDECRLVMEFVAGLKELGTRRVVLGHIVEASGMEGPLIAAKVDRARDMLRPLADTIARSGLDVEVRVGTGDPVQGLIGIANEAHVSAVVCGTHGKGLLDKFLAGSVSEQIAQQANVPVMLVRYDLLRTKRDPAEFARSFGRAVILPTDFSASSVRALLAALELPSRSLGTLYLLHVLDAGIAGDKATRAEQGAEFQLMNQRKIAEDQGIATRAVIKRGEPRRVILQEANERRATGVILGTRGQNMLQEAVLGSTSMTLIRQASCPVMIVP